ncbi:hypothetical protein tb265_04680 [Gemmatimonadetes bacterium T265]|nr:hypothetical protein tb265_04680 [Gemmatimonadetes bacterium T265]
MPNTTSFLGILLIVLGGWGYTQSATRSPMALIPSVLGVLFLALGIAAGREEWRKHAMHAAAALSLVGLVAGLGPVMMGGTNRFPPAMIRSTVAMSVLCGAFLVLAVRSFIAARRGRTAGPV